MSRAIEQTEVVTFACSCGKEWRQRVQHYDVIMCRCGGFVWALRPLRNGPLQSFIYPGDRTRLRIQG